MRLHFNLHDLDWDIDGFRVTRLVFTTHAIETTDITLHSEVELFSVQKKFEVASFKLSPITIWVGYVPVIIFPVVSINVGLDGEVSVGLETGASHTATLTAGIAYNNGTWTRTSSLSHDFDFVPPHITTSLQVKPFAEGQLSLLVYGVAGPYATVRGFVELDADVFAKPWWSLYGGIETTVGVKFSALGSSIADFESPNLIGLRVLLAQATTPAPTPTPTPTPTATPTPTPSPTPTPIPSPSPTPGPMKTSCRNQSSMPANFFSFPSPYHDVNGLVIPVKNVSGSTQTVWVFDITAYDDSCNQRNTSFATGFFSIENNTSVELYASPEGVYHLRKSDGTEIVSVDYRNFPHTSVGFDLFNGSITIGASSDSWEFETTTLTPTLFFNGSADPQFNNVSFWDGIVDSQGRLVIRAFNDNSCSFGNCSNLYSISPNGTLTWKQTGIGSAFFGRNLLLGPDDRVYVLHNVFGAIIFAFDHSGNSISGWPVGLPGTLGTSFADAVVIDQTAGTVYVRSGSTSGGPPFPATVAALNANGSTKWRVDYSDGALAGLYEGPNGNLFSFIQSIGLVKYNRDTGTQLCVSEANIGGQVGTPEGIFAPRNSTVIAVRGDCSYSTIYDAGPNLAVDSLKAAPTSLVGVVYQSTPFDPATARPFAITPNGTFLWRNNRIRTLNIADSVVTKGVLYVIGEDTADGDKEKLFLVDTGTGEILHVVETAPLLSNPGVAVAPDGTIYLIERNSVKIYRVSVP